jgi:hypothetical protein
MSDEYQSRYHRGMQWRGEGEHEGHWIEVVSNDTRRETLPGNVVRHILVRCRDCLKSWTFGEDRD